MTDFATRDSIGYVSTVELRIVRAAYARSNLVQVLAIVINRLGTLWLYPILLLVCFALEGTKIAPVLLAACLSVGTAHCIYPTLKKRLARPRPYQIDPTLKPRIQALDEYSLPSGHVMTLTATLIPVVVAFPYFLSVSVVLWAAIAWARIALAHHYPSDVAAGGALAAVISVPVSVIIL